MAEDNLAVWILVDRFAHNEIHCCARRFVRVVNYGLWEVRIHETGVD